MKFAKNSIHNKFSWIMKFRFQELFLCNYFMDWKIETVFDYDKSVHSKKLEMDFFEYLKLLNLFVLSNREKILFNTKKWRIHFTDFIFY